MLACCVIEIYGNDFDPSRLLDTIGSEIIPYHRNSYQIYVENDDITEALTQAARIINENYEQFRQILIADDQAELSVELRAYDFSADTVLFPSSILKLIGDGLITIKINCLFK